MALIAFFAISFSAAQTQQGQPKAGCAQGMQMHQSGGCSGIPNLTDDQMKKMEPLQLAFRKKKFEFQNQIKAKEAQLIIVSTGDKINKEEAYKLIDEISALKAAFKKAEFDYKMAIRALLTPEQQLAFDMHVAKGGNKCKPHGVKGCVQGNMQSGSCKPNGHKAVGCAGAGKGVQHGHGNCTHGE